MTADETARADLQTRMTALYQIMFWSLVALVGFVWIEYGVYSDVAPRYRDFVYVGSAVGLTAMALVWRGLLVRRTLTLATLHRLDLVYSSVIGACFGASAIVQYDFRPAAYMALIYSAATVFARALIVPSTVVRTAVASSLTFVPMTVAALVLAVATPQELPGPAFFAGYLLLAFVPIVLSTAGSHIIYGLRRQVSATQQLGQYILERKIGEGGMGAVYLARHLMLRRPTAVKLLLPDRVGADSLARFEREVWHMSQLTHPNTVAVFDYGRSFDGFFYYAMEYLGGGVDLDKLVARHGKQPSGRVANILAQVCGALQEAHDLGIVHRDIKPANIILCERGGKPDVAKVVDFGLVREISDASTQVLLGTPAYIAPEAVTDPSYVGPSLDLYAVGCVGYFLLTGRAVFEGDRPVDICRQHVTATPVPPSRYAEVPAELEAIVMRCLDKQPADRFATATELGEALRALPNGGWTDAKARQWWHERRGDHDGAAPSSSPSTLTIDLDTRDPDRTLPSGVW